MATHSNQPNFSQGWGIAGLITALAVGAFLLAGYIKSSTFHSPNDPTAPSGGASHAPAPADAAAPEAKH
ncbi:MAG: hypothetical protein IT361_18455 [Gemmatimonadaceae bacterium]|nr:hypothetical protein [Gemmatimonadaceae bacterium]